MAIPNPFAMALPDLASTALSNPASTALRNQASTALPHPPPVLTDTLTHFSGMLTDRVPLLLPASSCRPAAGVDESMEVTQVLAAQVKPSSSLRAKGRSSNQYKTRC